jgi:hypothetical protein
VTKKLRRLRAQQSIGNAHENKIEGFSGDAWRKGEAQRPAHCDEALLQVEGIGIFNRSYYEEVLVVRVHPEILAKQRLSGELRSEKSLWEDRYRSIVDLERHLAQNSTRTIKIFLHLSKEEQRKRFLDRIDEPHKNWKFSLADIHERSFWKQYVVAYEECISATSTHDAPWFIVPADDKDNARLIVSRIVIDALEELKMAYPKITSKREDELKSIRKLLVAQAPSHHEKD